MPRGIERYNLGPIVRRDSLSVTRQAHDTLLDREVWVRRFAPPERADAKRQEILRGKFLSQTRAQARLSHPVLPGVLDFGEEDRVLFAVLEKPEGRDLGERLELTGPMPLHEALDVARQLLGALTAAHEMHVYHGSMELSDLLVSGTGRVALLGVAEAAWASQEEERRYAIADLKAAAKVLWAMLVGLRAPMPSGSETLDATPAVPPRILRAITAAFYRDRDAGPGVGRIENCADFLRVLEDPGITSFAAPKDLAPPASEEPASRLAQASLALGASLSLVAVLAQVWELGLLGAAAAGASIAVGEKPRGTVLCVAGLLSAVVLLLGARN